MRPTIEQIQTQWLPLFETELGEKSNYTSLRVRDEKFKDRGKAPEEFRAASGSDSNCQAKSVFTDVANMNQLPSQASLMLVVSWLSTQQTNQTSQLSTTNMTMPIMAIMCNTIPAPFNNLKQSICKPVVHKHLEHHDYCVAAAY